MNLLSFTNNKDKAYVFIDASQLPERNISAIFLWQTVVLKNMVRDVSLLSCDNCVFKVHVI